MASEHGPGSMERRDGETVFYCKCGQNIGAYTKAADAENALAVHIQTVETK